MTDATVKVVSYVKQYGPGMSLQSKSLPPIWIMILSGRIICTASSNCLIWPGLFILPPDIPRNLTLGLGVTSWNGLTVPFFFIKFSNLQIWELPNNNIVVIVNIIGTNVPVGESKDPRAHDRAIQVQQNVVKSIYTIALDITLTYCAKLNLIDRSKTSK